MKQPKTKAYLIVFSRGKRFVEEFSKYEEETFTPVKFNAVTEITSSMKKTKLVSKTPIITKMSGIKQLICWFVLIGKEGKEGKIAWNKFLEDLKV